jgi:hypothetical protein
MKKLILLATLASAAASAEAAEPYTVRESGRSFARLQDAVDAIGGGTGTILIAPGTHRDCAVQEAGRISFVAARPGTVTFRGRVCEDKAALVLRGRSATVDGIAFEALRVSDGNGAGIRIEEGDLIVRNAVFRNSQSGILSSNVGKGRIEVDRSTFSGLGRCDGDTPCAHSIYVGRYGSLAIRRSRFEKGNGGHYLKSRAPRAEIRDSSFDDTSGRGTNYMIDLAEGAIGIVAGNVFVQGKNKENGSALVTVAPEGAKNSSNGLVISGNSASLAPGGEPTTFVADWSGHRIALENNRLGRGIRMFDRRR